MSEEIDAAVERRYEVVSKLGKGAYGIVWRVVDRKTKTGVALKKLFDAFSNMTDSQRTYREVMFLLRLSHENVIKILNVIRAENRMDIFLVFELMETDLYATIRCNVLQEIHKQYIAYQLLRCIRYLHKLDIVHRDLKPANILINSDCHVKLADFGLARSIASLKEKSKTRPVLTDYIATRWYRPPEIVLGCVEYTKAVDMWGVGCIIAEMLTGKPIFPGSSTLNQMERIVGALGEPTVSDVASMRSAFAEELLSNLPRIHPKPLRSVLAAQPREAVDLVSQLLVFNPTKRLTAAEAMRHPYVVPFATAEELLPDPPCEPLLLSISDNDRLSVDQYRDAIYKEIARRKKDHRKKRKEKHPQKLRTQNDSHGDAGAVEYEDDFCED